MGHLGELRGNEPVHVPPSQAGSVAQASPAPLELTYDPAIIVTKASTAQATRIRPARAAHRDAARRTTARIAETRQPSQQQHRVAQWTNDRPRAVGERTVKPPQRHWTEEHRGTNPTAWVDARTALRTRQPVQSVAEHQESRR